MSEMVERVARSIKRALSNPEEDWEVSVEDDENNGLRFSFEGPVDCAALARAAIEAMREPTADMTAHVSYVSGEWSRRNIEAFIDAALAEEKQHERA